MVLSTTVKFAPFATRNRRGYIRDRSERDLGAHLETALRGVIIGERWPKSGVDVIITVLEGEDDEWVGDDDSRSWSGIKGWGMLNVLAGCITASSAALVDAGIDCVDLVTGGVAAVVEDGESTKIVLDPAPAEHARIHAACVVAHLAQRDEITELWIKGDAGTRAEDLIEKAIEAAAASQTLLSDVLIETAKSAAPDVVGSEDAMALG